MTLLGSFFGWWYGVGWKQTAQSFARRQANISALFSVRLLLGTLFQPWRRIVSMPGPSLEDKLRAWGDNLVSRAVGFVVRIFVLLAAGCSLIIIGVLTVLEIIAWPLVPLAAVALIIKGLI